MVQTSIGHVFISYSRKDKAVMDRIAELLQERGINVWVDNKELVPGTSIWEAEIERAIRGASAVIVLLSPDSKKSRWVLSEVAFAEQHNKRIFPVLVRGDEKESIPIRLITSQFVDIRQNQDDGLHILFTELTRFLKELEVQDEAEVIEATNIEGKQRRILETAIENEITVGKSAQLFVLIRRLDSKGIISILQSDDEEIVLDESNLKAQELEIEFPIKQGRVHPASLSLRLTAPDFSPHQQLKHIKIPPDGDSEIVTFSVVPRSAGRLTLQLDVLAKEIRLSSRTIRTTAVESDETRKVKLLYSIPIVILAQYMPQGLDKINRTAEERNRQWKIQYIVIPIVVAVIGLLGTILSIIFTRDAPTPSSISTSANMLAPVPSSTVAPPLAVIPSVTFTTTPVCLLSSNQSPTIILKLEPVRVKVYGTAELTISVDGPENDPYEILAVTAEKGQFPNGKEEPYLYEAPGFPGKDIITVLVGDHECRTKEEITITIE